MLACVPVYMRTYFHMCMRVCVRACLPSYLPVCARGCEWWWCVGAYITHWNVLHSHPTPLKLTT